MRFLLILLLTGFCSSAFSAPAVLKTVMYDNSKDVYPSDLSMRSSSLIVSNKVILPWKSGIDGLIYATNGINQIYNLVSHTNLNFVPFSGSDASNSVSIRVMFKQNSTGGYYPTNNGSFITVNTNPSAFTFVDYFIANGLTNVSPSYSMSLTNPASEDNLEWDITLGGLKNVTGFASKSATLTQKTIDASASGNVIKFKKYLTLKGPDNITGAIPPNTNDVTLSTFMKPQFLNGTDKASNYIEWQITVPDDIDTAVEIRARLTFKLTGADTGTQRYVFSAVSVATSGAFSGTPATEVNMDFAGDASGASGDVEQVGWTTLTGHAATMTAGRHWVIRLARDGDTSDASTVDSMFSALNIEYGVTQ